MKKDVVSKIVLIVCICVFLFAGYQLVMIYLNYQEAENEYSNLAKQYIRTPEVTQSQEAVTEEELDYPPMDIDFDALREINDQVVGWLYVEACDISYPIVKGEDNEYYLNHTFEKNVNSSGAIFMDMVNNESFLNYNTFLYGHNMRNGAMFGTLKDLYRDDTLCELKPYVYVYLEEEVLKYQIFSYYITTDTSDSYMNFGTEEEYKAYVDKVISRSSYKTDLDMSAGNPLLSLSTCSGPSDGNQRFLVHCVLVGDYILEE